MTAAILNFPPGSAQEKRKLEILRGAIDTAFAPLVEFRERHKERLQERGLLARRDAARIENLRCSTKADLLIELEVYRAACGLDATLRLLGEVADELRNQGKG